MRHFDVLANAHGFLLLLACISFGLATIGLPSKVNLIALGLFLYSVSWFV